MFSICGLLKPMTILITSLVGMLVSAVLLRAGLRGRRINTHPLCRRCGFDLIGLNLGICPECGRDLHRRRAIRVGERKKRPLGIVLGALLLVVSTSVVATVLRREASRFKWNTIKPTWLLLRELRSLNIDTNSAARFELLDRMDDARLGASQLRSCLSDFIQEQADLKANALTSSSTLTSERLERLGQWGSVVVSAARAGLVAPSQVVSMVEGAVSISCDMRTAVPAGVPARVFWWIDASPSLKNDGDPFRTLPPLGFIGRLDSVRVGDRELSCKDLLAPVDVPCSIQDGRSEVLLDLPPGHYEAQLSWRFDVYTPADAEKPAGSFTRVKQLPIDIGLPDGPIVALRQDNSLVYQMEAAVLVQDARVLPVNGVQHVSLSVVVRGAPIPIVGRIGLRWNGKLIDIGTVSSRMNPEWPLRGCGGFGEGTCEVSADDRLPEILDVIITPDTEFACTETTVTEVWGRTIELNDVRFQRDRDPVLERRTLP